ncbi:MAG: lysylphosphatidylglycerol synthase transmembrane domain-containing protein [Chlamydiota bacterium]|nr:lysylphosphatidylglycerol synthase transmembrane domain-containing protein [Chlamydiota bacterium]
MTTTPSEHKHLLKGWRFTALIATIIFSVIGYFLFTLLGGWDKVIDGITKIGIAGIILNLCITCMSIFFRFSRWNYFLHTLGHKVPWLKSLKIYVTGFSLTTTPGKAGEALRSVFLIDYGVSYRRSFGALLAERLSDLLAVVVLSVGGLWAYTDARPIVVLSSLFIIFVLYAVQKDNWLKSIEHWTKNKLHDRFAYIVEFILDTVLAFRSCFSMNVLIYGTFFGSIAWAVEGIILYKVLHVLGADISLYTAIFIHAFSLLVGALTLLPGGLGGAEVTMYQLLLMNDVPTSTAVTATIIVRLCTLWFAVLLGIIALPKKQITLR